MFRRRSREDDNRDALSRLTLRQPPQRVWLAIERGLDRPAVRPTPWMRWLPAAACLIAALSAAVFFTQSSRVRWHVVRTSGAQTETEAISAGEWLQTDSSTTAQLQVGDIGSVRIEPGSKVRIIATRADNHRLLLDRGEISATISAPPRLFFVETKSATAVDLGCQYTMKVDAEGNGTLRVTKGWVSFERDGQESLVPAGASCKTRASAGPGTPYFDDASREFEMALDAYDFGGGSESSLRAILNGSHPRDTLTLWHLLSRVAPSLRPLIYDRMVSFAAPPSGVAREKALALDPNTLKVWKDELAWTW